MPSEFDKYLQKGNYNEQDRQALSQAKEEALSKDQSPIDQKNSFTPHPKDAGKQNPQGQQQTVEQAGQVLKQHTILDNWPANSSREEQSTQQHEKDDLDR